MITFLGTGLLGASFVRAALRRGEQVQVWNRSLAKAKALEVNGAKAFEMPKDAVRNATRIHLVLSDDFAVDDVLERAHTGFLPGTTIVDHTTTSPRGTRARAARWAERGVAFQHAPVFMGPANALEASGFMLASGDRTRFDALAPVLELMTGKLIYLGPQPERAAGIKLLGNLFIVSLTAALADVLALAKSIGIPAAEAAALFDFFNPGAMAPARMRRVMAADYQNPTWNLAMSRKDVRLMQEAATEGGMDLMAIPGVAAAMDRWLEKGHAADDWTIIAKDSLP
jgi:3-hydroxyisobutyrate dehydrogenase